MNKGIIFTLITAILFVTFEPVSKLIASDISPFAITFWRFAIGSLILLPPAIIKTKRENIKITAKDLALTTALGILFICISMTTLQYAVKIADAPSLIAIIFSSNSVFTIVFAVLIVKEKMSKSKAISLIFGVIGVLLCADFSSGTNLSSAGLALFAALSFSLYTALSQKYMKKLSGVIQSALVFLTGSIVLFIILLFTEADIIPTFNSVNIGILVYLGLFVTGIGYALYFKAIEKGGAILGALAFFIKPILTPFVTYFINDIKPNITTFVAIICIVIASYFAIYKKNR